MKTKIAIGSLLAVLMLMMIPSISAVEFNIAAEPYKSKIDMLKNKIQFNEEFKNFNIDKIQDIIDNWELGDILKIIFGLLLIILYVILTWLKIILT